MTPDQPKPTSEHAADLGRIQRQHCLLSNSILLLTLALAAFVNFRSGIPIRAWLFTIALVPLTWICFRALFSKPGILEAQVGLFAGLFYVATPSLTNPLFTQSWQAIACISFVLGFVASFGTQLVATALIALFAGLAVAATINHFYGLEWLVLAPINAAAETYSLWFYIFADSAFLLMIARQVRAALNNATAARDSALAAQSAESRFLSNMSHEIRNPLHGIQGLLETIQTKATDTEVRADAELALQITERLKALLNDVLDYQKLREGKLGINNQCFETDTLRMALKGTVDALLRQQNKNLAYQLLSDTTNMPRWIYGDPTRIFQVIINLMSNAFKFTASGSVTVRTHYVANTSEFVLAVTDTGPGMSEDTLKFLFERFRQGSEGLSKAHEGSGLGLAIAHELTVMMHGSLNVASRLGEGSTFTLRLPLPACQPPDTVTHDIALPPNDANLVGLEGLTFLCVDDDLVNLRVLKSPLAAAGASVLVASSGSEAMELLTANGVHMVLTDISMPNMDGTELRQWIGEHFPELPVIAVTGNALPSDITHYRALGFADVLSKPFRKDELLSFVTRNVNAAFGPLDEEK